MRVWLDLSVVNPKLFDETPELTNLRLAHYELLIIGALDYTKARIDIGKSVFRKKTHVLEGTKPFTVPLPPEKEGFLQYTYRSAFHFRIPWDLRTTIKEVGPRVHYYAQEINRFIIALHLQEAAKVQEKSRADAARETMRLLLEKS